VKRPNRKIEDVSLISSILSVALKSSADISQLYLLNIDVFGGVGWRSKTNDVAETWQYMRPHALRAAHICFADTH
jgi:hypothetical protein